MDKQGNPTYRKFKAMLPSRQMGMFLVLILTVFGIFTFIIPNFNYVRIANLNNMLTDSVIPAIFAFGMGMILAVGGFDLSLGHIASLSALIIAYLMSGGIKFDPVSAILVGVLAAAVIGFINGLLVSRMGISSFIVTLGMQFLIIGIRQIVTHGQSVYISNSLFKSLAKTQLGVSNLVFVLLIIALLCYLLMEKSTFGRRVQFIGENIEASRFMGIDVKQLTMYTFILGAICAAIGGALFAARAGAVQINSVDSKLLDAITISVFSGVIFTRFRVMGIIMVAILISMISTGMSMLGIKTEWIEFIKGLILLSSIFFAKVMSVNTSLAKLQLFHKLKRSN